MKRSLFLAAGAAAGLMLLAPAAALATTPTTPTATPTTPTTTSPAPSDGPTITLPLSVDPAKARPGDRVKLAFGCVTRHGEVLTIHSVALDFDRTGAERWGSAKVKDVKPGKYDVVMGCGAVTSTASIQVLPKKTPAKKQVEKVPAGAPQTGGTDGPVDGGPDGVAMAAGAMGVLAVGGAGLVVARRRRSQ